MERSAALLSMTDVIVIRRYVQTKYAPLPGGRRAEIVAEAIRSTIGRRLPSLPEEWKRSLTDDLIRRCVIVEQRDVQAEDVLEACAQREWDPGVIREPLLAWMQELQPGRWTEEQLTSRLNRGRRESRGAAADPEAAAAASEAVAVTAATAVLPGSAGANGTADAAQPVVALAVPVDAEPEALPDGAERERRLRWHLLWASLAVTLAVGVTLGYHEWRTERQAVPEPLPAVEAPAPAEPDVGMPPRLRYADIDTEAVKAYLRGRDSMLADEPYFSAIVDAARTHDVHPLLLFAVTGQEQGFVPKSSKHAEKIANNPFNVYHSWQEFNTDIYHSADIAGRTLANSAKKRPEGYEPFAWFNTTYAEDPNWSTGVRKLFEQLTNLPKSQSQLE